MAVLLLAEVNDGELAMDATAKAVTAAQALGDVTVLATGATCADAAQSAATISGVAKVLCAEDAIYGKRLAEPVADLLVSLAGDYDHIVAPATTDAKNIMPRVAALLDVMVISDATAVIDADTFERPIYAGNAIQTVNPRALEIADSLDGVWDSGAPRGALHCVPVLLKDQVETVDMPTTYGSVLFADFVSHRDATLVRRLKGEWALILAKTNMGEFASRYVGSAFGIIRNPYDPTRNPSGSSGGSTGTSGAAVGGSSGAAGGGSSGAARMVTATRSASPSPCSAPCS